jgi:HPt (histidine-containing phosphotransfer) domain-containing protein
MSDSVVVRRLTALHADVQRCAGTPLASAGRVTPTAASAATLILDRSILDDLRALDESIVTDLIKTFIDDVPARILRIRASVAAADADQVSREAHGLKGSALAVGATRLAALCLTLEEHARAGRKEHLSAPCTALDDAFAEVRQQLQAMC